MQVAIETDPTYTYGRSVIRGAIRYLKGLDVSIDVHILAAGYDTSFAQISNYDGFLLTSADSKIIELSLQKPIVALDVVSDLPANILSFSVDNYEVGRIAAETLYSRGVLCYGYYYGHGNNNQIASYSSENRLAGFRDRLIELGVQELDKCLHIHHHSTEKECYQWLNNLPKPVGIFAFHDFFGLTISSACRLLNLSIPKEVVLVGVNNNELICSLCRPLLSSIDIDIHGFGYSAMSALVEMLPSGKKPDLASFTLKPSLISRESTGGSSVGHETVRTALAVIESGITSTSILPMEVARASGISLRGLEILFKEHLGRSVRDEIQEKQLDHFKLLLRSTDLNLDQISERLGQEPFSLQRSFTRIEGVSPGKYRQVFRGSVPPLNTAPISVHSKLINICLLSKLQGRSAYDYVRGVRDYLNESSDVNLTVYRPCRESREEYTSLFSKSAMPSFYDGFIVPPGVPQSALEMGNKPVICFEHLSHMKQALELSIDNYELGVLAARYYLAKGYGNFAYADHTNRIDADNGQISDDRSLERYLGFHQTLINAGVVQGAQNWTVRLDATEAPQWLLRLPRPSALLAFNDTVAAHLVSLCKQSGLRVPQDITLLGIDNDELVCNLSQPSLSSIDIGFRRAGYESMHVLVDRIRQGGEVEQKEITFPPLYVMERGSTAGIAPTDSAIVSAMKFMEQRYAKSISIMQIVEASSVGRSTLEKRFRIHMGNSIANCLKQIRLDTAKKILITTECSIAEIAEQVGFEHAQHFCQLFKRETGMTPRMFRHSRAYVGPAG